MSRRCYPEIIALKCTRSYAIYYFLLNFFLGIVLDDDLLMIADQSKKKSHPLTQRVENAVILPEKSAGNIQRLDETVDLSKPVTLPTCHPC